MVALPGIGGLEAPDSVQIEREIIGAMFREPDKTCRVVEGLVEPGTSAWIDTD